MRVLGDGMGYWDLDMGKLGEEDGIVHTIYRTVYTVIAQPREDWTRMCSEGLAVSQNAPNGSYGSYAHSTFMGNA